MVRIEILKKIKNNYFLVIILLFAAIVRYWGIGFGLPNINCRPDEEHIVDIIHSPSHHFHPGDFIYPSLYKYINLCFYGLYFIVGLFAGKYRFLSDFTKDIVITNYSALYLINRFLSASFGVATVFICYKAAKRLFDKKTAIVSAFFLSLAYLHVRDSHFGTCDVPMTFFIMCSMFFIIRSRQDNLMKNYILAGVFAGLAASTKYLGFLLIMPMLIVNSLDLFVTKGEDKAFVYTVSCAKRMLFFMIFFIAAFLLGTPYAVLDVRRFIADCLLVASMCVHGGPFNIYGRGWWYHLRFSLLSGMGFSLFFASLAGMLMLAKTDFKKALILCSFPLVYYAAIGIGYAVFLRYAVPLVPFFCITAAVFTMYIINGFKKYLSPSLNKTAMLMVPLLIILPSVYNILHCDILLSKKDNRLVAAEWINGNLPEGSPIAMYGSELIQLFPTVSGLLSKDMSAENKIMADYLIKNRIKGFNAYTWDGQSTMSKYIVLEESHVYSAAPEQKEIIQKFYYLLSEFKSMNMENRSNWFDPKDSFYLPFTGFKEIQRPGPNIYIYEKK